MSIDRRTFVGVATGILPLMVFGSSQPQAKGCARGFLVSAGRGRSNETLHLFDRSWIDFKVTTADTDGNFFMIEQRELRRFGPPRHVHPEQDEWFRPLKGTYRIEIGDEKFLAGPGDFVFAPRGVPHVWTHVEDDPGGMMVAFQPAGKMEAFFHEFTKFAAMPPANALRALFHAHGMEIVGPPLPLE
ncbi:MAG: cupin domain-containing protein [Lacunisphaera sp.]